MPLETGVKVKLASSSGAPFSAAGSWLKQPKWRLDQITRWVLPTATMWRLEVRRSAVVRVWIDVFGLDGLFFLFWMLLSVKGYADFSQCEVMNACWLSRGSGIDSSCLIVSPQVWEDGGPGCLCLHCSRAAGSLVYPEGEVCTHTRARTHTIMNESKPDRLLSSSSVSLHLSPSIKISIIFPPRLACNNTINISKASRRHASNRLLRLSCFSLSRPPRHVSALRPTISEMR